MRWLRQSTAREIAVGPMLASADGYTPMTALTVTQAEVLLKKNEGDWTQKTEATSLVHESNGWYRCLLAAGDVDTLGVLMLQITEATALPIWHEFMVVTANVWDSLFGADVLDVSTTQWLGTAVTAGTAGVPNVDITRIANAAVSTSSAQIGVNVVNAGGTAWGSGAITAGSIAADAITAAKVASDVSTEFATAYFGTAIPGAFGAGTAGSRLGKLPDATAGAAGGVFIAGTNAATSVTTSFTTTFTGNLTGSVGSVTGNVGGNVTGSVGTVNALAANSMTASALATDAVNEIAAAVGALAGADPAGVPATTASLAAKIDWLCALARNKRTTTATTETLRNDADSGSVATATISDDATTFTRLKWT